VKIEDGPAAVIGNIFSMCHWSLLIWPGRQGKGVLRKSEDLPEV